MMAEKRRKVDLHQVTCSAGVNIAVIKYWGKRDVTLNLPANSSLSGTLGQDHLKTTTSIAASPDFAGDRLWLNGKEEDISNPRLRICLQTLREIAKREGDKQGLANFKLHICSINNFPTAAGLASSASGYACLVFTLSKLFKLEISMEELSTVARQGSGSACRSLFGGFVKWEMGRLADGTDSKAVQVAPETHWPEMEVLILVVSDHKKGISSTSGMQTSMSTSELLRFRAEKVVPNRMKEMEQAILNKDFETFGRLTIQDSNQFHAVCLDTYPPIFYMNDVSRTIIHMLTKLNANAGKIKAAYTYDAGPNAVIYALKENIPEILQAVLWFFPPAEDQNPSEYFNDRLHALNGVNSTHLKEENWYKSVGLSRQPGCLRYILHTVVGDAPKVLSLKDCLLNEEGFPKEKIN